MYGERLRIPSYASVLHTARAYAVEHLTERGSVERANLTGLDHQDNGYPVWLVELAFSQYIDVVTLQVVMQDDGALRASPLVEGFLATKSQVAEAYRLHEVLRTQGTLHAYS
ncbi:MAG: hypothetical protein H0T73_05330 [Ardenticatenales bacterium]|nr:hypothetical protein [Ardenticatenales bacterium]